MATTGLARMARYAIAGLALASAAPVVAAELPKRLLKMTPEAFASAVTVHEDAATSRVILSTEKGFVPRSALHSVVDDNHIRAVVDRRTGAVRYEVHQSMRYWGDRRDYVAVQYPAPGGARETALKVARHGADNCPAEDIMVHCSLTKHVVFEIDAQVLRHMAENSGGWTYTIRDKGGAHLTDAIAPAEAAGLIEATRRYLGSHS